MKYYFMVITLFSCLFISTGFISADETHKNNVNQSATDKDIKLTVDNYSVNGHELIVNFTVQTNGSNHIDKTSSLIETPDVFIDKKRINEGSTQWYKKVNNQKYQGTVKLDMPNTKDKPFSVKFNTDVILDKEGQWTVDFKVE
ncbi:protein of unknown function [Oceanobacillus limi]|uniref:DUF4352 domain-containing protein n=1 Tax=Oceanobacillus limi TaxID=930131 RepID=A0A1H9ZC11_9BACI|nr:DUF4179 domain-containing protein [Oceanobacillus limi]SES78868.1 protein of unknown function [Oceanobacillus limi]